MVNLVVSFTLPTNFGGGGGCKNALTSSTAALLGGGFACHWADAQTLVVELGAEATVNLTSTFTISPNRIRSYNGLSAPMAEQGVTVLAPVNMLEPVALPRSPLKIGPCEDCVINGMGSQGNAGRPFTFHWTMFRALASRLNSAQFAAVDAYLQTQNTANSNIIAIPNALLPASREYVITLTVTNWLGMTASSSIAVTKSALNVPVLLLQDKPVRHVNIQDAFEAGATVQPSPCGAGEKIIYKWVQTAGPHFLEERFSRNQFLMVGPLTFLPGETYRLQATASLEDAPGVSNAATLTIVTSTLPLVARIEGSSRVVSKVRDFVLDATASNDPMEQYSSQADPLNMQWSCRRLSNGGLCFSQEQALSLLPEEARVKTHLHK